MNAFIYVYRCLNTCVHMEATGQGQVSCSIAVHIIVLVLKIKFLLFALSPSLSVCFSVHVPQCMY